MQRAFKAPLIAVLGLLALFALPAAAQAHHVDSKAECTIENGNPTVRLTASFIGFNSTKDVSGTVKVDGATTFTGKVPVVWNGNNGTWVHTAPGAAGKASTVETAWTWKGGTDGEKLTAGKCPVPPKPGLTIDKDGPAKAYVGDQADFTYKVTNTGNVKLPEPVVTDDKCAPVTKVTDQNSFDPGDVWTYTCTTTITDAMGDQLVNVGKACVTYGGKPLCDDDTHTTEIPKPGIELVKSGADTATAGETFTYTFAVTNTGNATLDPVVLTDDKCQSTLKRDPAETDTTFDKGDVWHFTCTVVAPTGPATVHNTAEVCGTNGKVEVCDTDEHTFTVPEPPVTPTPPADNPPATTPPAQVPTTPVTDGGVLPARSPPDARRCAGRAAASAPRSPRACTAAASRRSRTRSTASA